MNRRVIAIIFAATTALLGLVSLGGAVNEDSELAELMERNRRHFRNLVEVAYFESVQKELSSVDYQRIRQEAEAISTIALQARREYSRGEKFNDLASELEKHAEKTAKAAARENLPEINIQIGEMAEYCAGCHNAHRW